MNLLCVVARVVATLGTFEMDSVSVSTLKREVFLCKELTLNCFMPEAFGQEK